MDNVFSVSPVDFESLQLARVSLAKEGINSLEAISPEYDTTIRTANEQTYSMQSRLFPVAASSEIFLK